jgi:site-specific recombinase XerD
MNGKPDLALLAVLIAYGLRRHEAVKLNISHLQKREDHCGGIVDLIGKAAHIRTIPVCRTGSTTPWAIGCMLPETRAGGSSGK